jgi:hypothetical protein
MVCRYMLSVSAACEERPGHRVITYREVSRTHALLKSVNVVKTVSYISYGISEIRAGATVGLDGSFSLGRILVGSLGQ